MTNERISLTCGEVALWRAVIAQAMLDAQKTFFPSNNSFNIFDVNAARKWLRGENKDFHLVCEYAAIDPHYAREKIKELLGTV